MLNEIRNRVFSKSSPHVVMTLTEYSRYYLDIKLGVLGGNHGHFSLRRSDDNEKTKYDNYRSGLLILTLISLAESSLISKSDFKALRRFQPTKTVPSTVNQTHLSGFIYLRDCIAHNPNMTLLPDGKNTEAFLSTVINEQFPFVKITKTSLNIENTHELHLIVLRLYGLKV